jgi:hypothetical protein
MTDEIRKIESIKFAQESAKQIIALSTAVVTLTFGAVSIGALELHNRTFWFALTIVVLLVFSIVAGIFTLFALSGILSSKQEFASESPLSSAHYSFFGQLQFYTFVGAVVLMAVFLLLWPEKKAADRKIEITLPEGIFCRAENSELTCKALGAR